MAAITVAAVDHRRPSIAARIHAVQMAAYALEAELIGAREFPPLGRTVQDIRGADQAFFGAFAGADLVGAVGIEADEVPAQTLIASVVVAPGWQRRGIGRRLVQQAVAASPHDIVVVATSAKNAPALALYASLGFRPFERRSVGPEAMALIRLKLARTAPAP